MSLLQIFLRPTFLYFLWLHTKFRFQFVQITKELVCQQRMRSRNEFASLRRGQWLTGLYAVKTGHFFPAQCGIFVFYVA